MELTEALLRRSTVSKELMPSLSTAEHGRGYKILIQLNSKESSKGFW